MKKFILYLLSKHDSYILHNDKKEIFTGICKEENHSFSLDYFCKNHNQLCYIACIDKINDKGIGQHKDCDVCTIEKIKEEKNNKLKENINILEELSKKIEESINEMKKALEKIDKNKEELKFEIQKIFTTLRNAINEREDHLLSKVDKQFNEIFGDEKIVKENEKLPNKIKASLEKGKIIENQWEENKLNSLINDCINIENNINEINENINKYNINNNIHIEFDPKEESLNSFLDTIKSFGKIYNYGKFHFKKCPENIKDNRKYMISEAKGNILTKTGSGSWMGTICEHELEKSKVHRWKIKLLKVTYNNIMVGVAPIDFNKFIDS